VIVVVPADIAATATDTLVAPAVKLTVRGTVALLVSLEFRLTVKPPACPLVSVKVRFPTVPVTIDGGDPVKAIVGAATVTVPVPDV